MRSFVLGVFILLSGINRVDGALPPLGATLEGDFRPFADQSDFTLHWKIVAASPEADQRTSTISIAGLGTKVKASATVDAVGLDGKWRVEAANVDAGAWFSPLARRFLPAFTSTAATGSARVTGEGTIQQGRPAGAFALAWENGAWRDDARGWNIDGLSARITFPRWPAWGSDDAQTLAFSSASMAGIALTNGKIVFKIQDTRRIAVASARVEALGGELSIDPFEIDLAAPEPALTLRVSGIDTGQLGRFLPHALAEIKGRVDGELRARWSLERGLELGEGRLTMNATAPASLRLAPTPGFFTSRLPARIQLLPARLGTLARWLSQENPAYDTLKKVEEGQMPLTIDSVEADFDPAGGLAGCTARVHVIAHPADTHAVAKVTFNVNVSGPLADVVRIGLNDRISFGR